MAATATNHTGNFGLIDVNEEQRNREITQEYINYFDDSKGDNRMYKRIEDFVTQESSRIIVNVDSLRERLPERADGLMKRFVDEVVCIEAALKDVYERTSGSNEYQGTYHVGFEGSFGDRHVNPRSLKSLYLGNLVCCEGIVTKCSSVKPKVVTSVHYCPATKKTLERKYTDMTDYTSSFSSNHYPHEDENKNPLVSEYGLSEYKDHQTFSLQELPECAPAGQLPRSLDIIADWDLSDVVQPGDRVRVIGLYRVLPRKHQGYTDCSFRSILIANNIQLMSKLANPDLESEDIKRIRKMAKQHDIFDLLSRSLAPSIYGHDEVKKGILCLLLGGDEKITESGVRIRGDINVLLIGDPSVAKSQLLRYVLHTAPRAITTTGRGSSGVGLTAAVTTDPESGERRLEAGAMVLADRGVVCIDEFDKMSDADRTSIHEVMEQGRVTIAKAGIQAQLNARCSVLAAANPVYGRYDPYKTPMENINMQDSLLSRFDLVFVLRDEHNTERDRNVAEQVLKMHRYRAKGEADGAVLKMGDGVRTITTQDTVDHDEMDRGDGIFEKDRAWTAVSNDEKVLTMDFVKKFIKMAKNNPVPELPKKVRDMISDAYAELRSVEATQTDTERTMIVTVRQLESLIRLSTSISRCRLAKEVDVSDVQKAYQLLHFACFKEKPRQKIEWEKRHAKKGDAEGEEDEEMDEGIERDEEEVVSTSGTRTRKRVIDEDDEEEEESVPMEKTTEKKRKGGKKRTADESAMDTSDALPDTVPIQPQAKKARAEPTMIGTQRYKVLRKYVRKAFDDMGIAGDFVEIERVTKKIEELCSSDNVEPFEEGELSAGLEKMSDDNAVMINEDKMCII